MSPVPELERLCACGCRQPVGVATRTRPSRGWVKGEPLRFVSGHNRPAGHDLTGQTFGRLTALHVLESGLQAGRKREWVVECSCGNVSFVQTNKLLSGHTRSCGCLVTDWEEGRRSGRRTHGHTGNNRPSPTYVSWVAMKARCLNPANHNFPLYGGRGITVCERWAGEDGFINFLADMGERPDGKTLEREDNDGNYEPSNCTWATVEEQNANKRDRLPRIPPSFTDADQAQRVADYLRRYEQRRDLSLTGSPA